MKPILDRVAAQWRSDFRPTSPSEFFALRLAYRLGEPQMARQLALVASERGVEKLTAAFQRSVAGAKAGEDLARRLHKELVSNGRNGTQTPCVKLAGIRVERRCVGAAIFRDTRLESVRIRQLPANALKAETTIATFIGQLIREHGFESAGLEVVPATQEIQRTAFTKIVFNQLRENFVSVWELHKNVVVAAFGHPPLKTRTELRQVIQTMWPQLQPKRDQICILDAAAMGLFIQTERLFNQF